MTVLEVIEKYKDLIGIYSVQIKDRGGADCIIRDFREAFSEKKIILYGAGCVGRDFVLLFSEMNIPIEHIVAKNWMDNKDCCGITVENPEILRRIDQPDEYVLIAACDRKIMPELTSDLEKLGTNFDDMVCGHDIHMLMQSSWCMRKAEDGRNIDLKNCYECTCLDNTCKSLCEYLKRINGFDEAEAEGTERVKMIGYLLSNICTLNCKNCCESVPYMPKETKRFVPGETVIRDIEKMSSACNFLTLMEFIGGEPFLHPELPDILARVLQIRNIGMVHIFTNGTVIPNDALCRELDNDRITVYLSNYQVSYPDQFKDKVMETVNKLEQYHVQYFFGKKQNWNDFSGYELQEEEESQLRRKFPDCFLHNCNRLMDGQLYVCPHQYAGIKLGKLENENTLDIHACSAEELANELEKFKDYPYISACKYCAMPYHAPTVLSGEQL
ncbi:MAG: radical SAM protein [Lachnospiraceae bacterium]|nr:radical SAM protein [Lachnospiraceae bacterium]